MHHCAIFCRNRSIRCSDIAIFQFVQLPPSLILEILKFYWLTGHRFWRAKMHQRAKFCQNPSIHCRFIAIFQFFMMAGVAILDF